MEENNAGYGCLYKVMMIVGLIGFIGILFILATEGFAP